MNTNAEPAPAPSAASPLDAMLCFALYRASNAVAQAYRDALAPWNLTYTQYIALVALSTAPDGLTVGALGTRLGLDSGTLSPMLRRLDERGLVSRERRDPDERRVTVTLTDTGAHTFAELADAVQCISPRYGVSSAEEFSNLLAALGRIESGMRAAAPGAAAAGSAAAAVAAAPAAASGSAASAVTPPHAKR
ncbi:MarR family winged helix-turn-helix transcriptional regulator [Herbiconiux liangxiaofengii]|uniref:MarR family winged helix-turn-helix transcriptional regulator n=1 Tax=Herbiconiux liangxiaofengii TaxID=3342795 RepID=UPI0035BA5815